MLEGLPKRPGAAKILSPYQKSPQIFFWRLWAEKVNFWGPNLVSYIVPKSSSGGPWGPSGAQGAAGALLGAILEACWLHLGSMYGLFGMNLVKI